MPCYRPLKGWKSRERTASGKRKIVFNVSHGYRDMPVTVPCGQCIGCKLDKSRQWAIRCVHESKSHVQNCFITLTYSDENLPKNESLNKEDFQKFMKRLRKDIENEYPGRKVRYFACGEYGESGKRPHYHALLFGHDFDDKSYIGGSGSNRLYTSDKLSDVWGFGFVTIGKLTFDSAAYVARYCTKKITGINAETHYAGRTPEFCLMSRANGIGYDWFAKNYSDYERAGNRIILDSGISVKAARYYENIYERRIIGEYNGYKGERKRVAKFDRVVNDNTPERLAVKEKIALWKQKQKSMERVF